MLSTGAADPPAAVAALTAMGFRPEAATTALEMVGHDRERAVQLLLDQAAAADAAATQAAPPPPPPAAGPPPPAPAATAGSGSSASTPNTLFVKIERLRRLHVSHESTRIVRKGPDGSYGLGLSEDNEVVKFYHDTNEGTLRIGDQIRSVGSVPLVRHRLASVLQEHYGEEEAAPLRISRAAGPADRKEHEVFVSLQLRSARGDELDEWVSDMWRLRTDAVWGTFWTMPIHPRARSAWMGMYISKLFTEPLHSWVELELDAIEPERLDTRWYSLRAEGTSAASSEHVGEILLTVRRFYAAGSVCPDGRNMFDAGSSDEEEPDPSTVSHAAEPMAPIVEETFWAAGSPGPAPQRRP